MYAGEEVVHADTDEKSPETIAIVRTEANARLIAAAPEMLEALKTMRREFFNNGIDGLSSAQGMAIGRAMNAIAKAEGSSDA